MEQNEEINFKDFEFKEVEPNLKDVGMARWAHKILVYPRRIYINRALEEIAKEIMSEGQVYKPRYAKYLIDEKNQFVAIQFSDVDNKMNLPIHYSNTKRTYVSTPFTIAQKYRPILRMRRDGTKQPTYIKYYYNNGMILFSYTPEEEAST